MSFDVPADAYVRFMGRYSVPLADQFIELVGCRPGDRVLDVGSGPGILTAPLVDLCGPESVAAVDPSQSFVDAARERFPGADVRLGGAEELPYDDGSFDATLAQLVVQFMTDPVRGLREMGRVTRPGGIVAANVWDHAGDTGPLSLFYRAAREVDPDGAPAEEHSAGSRQGHLASLAEEAGLTAIRSTSLTVRLRFTSFDEWWAPYHLGVGPPGDYLSSADEDRTAAVRERCRELLPEPPFEHAATAWVLLAHAR